MTMTVEDYYDGFRTFSWLADFIDVPIDQVRNATKTYVFFLFLSRASTFLIYLSTVQKEGASIELQITMDICRFY
ncbi:hypothetical protein WN51_11017 [Melipona quadrifasciata]|uniref:Uncharacterized protein n=1 Tax=Melipona quadrifasciata TaxID=166423 RepID=A0A0N0BHY8_9HYME|nr:hypothetical protein WN51_11017 [Melipona quadrifasciata]